MKKAVKYILFALVNALLMYFFIYQNDKVEEITEKEKNVWAVSLQIAKELKDKYDLNFIGLGQSVDNNKLLKNIKFSFILDKVLKKDEGRKLMLNCADDLLNKINSSKEIQPFLAVHPFQEQDIQISIFLYLENNYDSFTTII